MGGWEPVARHMRTAKIMRPAGMAWVARVARVARIAQVAKTV